ncbi:MAG: superoxide dismutase family protein [Pseudomonadota bacterium]
MTRSVAGLRWLTKVVVGVLSALIFVSLAGAALACKKTHTIQSGESFVSLAEKFYGDANKWIIIFYANPLEAGFPPRALQIGQALKLPCAGQRAASPVSTAAISRPRLDSDGVISLVVAFNLTTETGVGKAVGFASVEEVRVEIAGKPDSALAVRVDLNSLSPGPHALHIHSKPDCGPGIKDGKVVLGMAAGGHLYLYGTGPEAGQKFQSHLGDLPDITVDADGTSRSQVLAPRLRLKDVRGRSLVVHATGDDNSYRQACAVIP